WRAKYVLIVLHHAGEAGADPHAGADAAAVHVERPDERARPVFDRGLGHARVHHHPHRDAAVHAAGRDNYGLAGADIDQVGALIDIAVLPEAFEPRASLWMHARRVAGLDPDDAAGEGPLANELVHMAVEHEAHALLAR